MYVRYIHVRGRVCDALNERGTVLGRDMDSIGVGSLVVEFERSGSKGCVGGFRSTWMVNSSTVQVCTVRTIQQWTC